MPKEHKESGMELFFTALTILCFFILAIWG